METECQKPTKKYPNGRTGTHAGISAHRKAKEKNCEACAELKREHDRDYARRNKDKRREYFRLYREKNRVELKAKKKEYAEKNAEAMRERTQKWREENKEKVKAYNRKYRKNNLEKCLAIEAKWREENAEHKKTYYQENQEKWEGYVRKRRALRASQPHEPYTKEQVVELHGTKCYLCGGEVDINLAWGNDRSPAMDHKWPLNVPGGPGDVLSNMWFTHAVCNIRKGDRMVEDLNLPFAEPESREWSYATIDSELV